MKDQNLETYKKINEISVLDLGLWLGLDNLGTSSHYHSITKVT